MKQLIIDKVCEHEVFYEKWDHLCVMKYDLTEGEVLALESGDGVFKGGLIFELEEAE